MILNKNGDLAAFDSCDVTPADHTFVGPPKAGWLRCYRGNGAACLVSKCEQGQNQNLPVSRDCEWKNLFRAPMRGPISERSPSMKCLALAIVASTLIAEYAYACPPCGPSMPSAPSMSTPYVPSAPRVSPLTVPGVGAVQSAVRDAVDFASIKTKVRAKNPNATEAQIEAGTQKVIERRKRRDDELTAYIREGMAEYRRKQRDEEFRNRIDKEVAERRQRENERMLREDDQRIRQGLIDMGLKAARERREREIEDMHALIDSKNNMDKFMKELEAKRLAKEGGQSLISGLNHEERMMLGPGLVWMLPPVHLPH